MFQAACVTNVTIAATMSPHPGASISLAGGGSVIDDIYGNALIGSTQDRILKTAAMINASKQHSTKRINNIDAGMW